MNNLTTTPDLLSELQFLSSRSSGPGGQNVNKVNSRVELRFDVVNSRLLSEEQKAALLIRLASKITAEGILIVTSQISRSQLPNKEDALNKFNRLIQRALTPRKPRKATHPTKASVEKRLTTKKLKSQIKKNRSGFGEQPD